MFFKKVCEGKKGCYDYSRGTCSKTERTKGHDGLNHVGPDTVKKEVMKRREKAQADGIEPDGTGP